MYILIRVYTHISQYVQSASDAHASSAKKAKGDPQLPKTSDWGSLMPGPAGAPVQMINIVSP